MANDYRGGDCRSKQRGLSILDDRPISNDMVHRPIHRSGSIRAGPGRVGGGYRRVSRSHWGYLLSLVGQTTRRQLFHPCALCPRPPLEAEEGIEKEGTGSRIISLPEVSDQEIREEDKAVVPNRLPSTPIQVHTSTPYLPLSNTRSHIISPPKVADQEIPEGDVDMDILPTHLRRFKSMHPPLIQHSPECSNFNLSG